MKNGPIGRAFVVGIFKADQGFAEEPAQEPRPEPGAAALLQLLAHVVGLLLHLVLKLLLLLFQDRRIDRRAVIYLCRNRRTAPGR